ncbi:Intradiol ring-cleavage dioxygenase, core [Beauveria bassiana ARSEF 2860]|uniref:Intradiol ring-cleavage dioxygenase, core n=1 Tax=Beauveria bassiana (strain ARSEF 2860) TaxID=655819 RepID=J4KQ44_BEAB2|nr:Intradiol ring-cleavage dioxygenase, core [Beauveria bassiana ARSEF 2860]EJP68559.1 Intradiol ring-cleavage dioxygenase, core [Beauveria bassiana ARSEF 2860]
MASTTHATTPELLDLTPDNITPNTVRINAQCADARLRYLMERLVTHLHDFARETRLSTDEWMAAVQFLTRTGQICSDVRQEFILLSDVLGLSLLVDAVNHPKPPSCTESSLLGPFHTHDAPVVDAGAAMSADPAGEPLLVLCTVRGRDGRPIPDVKVDIWETDSSGHYDVQHADREEPSERCIMHSDAEGKFWFKAIAPVSYPIPSDGPVGQLLQKLGRHPWRPAHMHFMLEKPGWDHLITAVFVRGDPYEKTDAVFGVKESLIVDLEPIDEATAAQYGVEPRSKVLRQDFVLATEEETTELRDKDAVEALKSLGLNMKLVDHLPVPDLD